MRVRWVRLVLLSLALCLAPKPGLAEGAKSFPLMLVAAADYVGDRSDTAVLAEIDQVIAVANRYLDPLEIQIVLAGVQLERGRSSLYSAGAAAGPETVLQFIKLDWSDRSLPERAAVAVLLRTAPNGVAGLSYSSTACLNPRSAVLYAAAGSGENAVMRLGATVAHEIGHLLGMEHDAKLYSNGVSLMWPQVSAFANGFSLSSREQLKSYAQRGGLSCLPSGYRSGTVEQLITEGQSELHFIGGDEQIVAVQEGEELRFSVRLANDEPGAVIWAEGLPTGAAFDPLSGELSFTPGYATVASGARERAFTCVFAARTAVGTGKLVLQLKVREANRPPQFVGEVPASVTVAPGERTGFTVAAVDPDGDPLQIRQRVVSTTLRRDAVRVRCSRARCEVSFAPKARRSGNALVEIVARDARGAAVRKLIALNSAVGGASNANVLMPAQLNAVLGSGTPLLFTVVGEGAELDIAALPAGWAVRRDRGTLALYALGGQYKPSVAPIELLVREHGTVRRVPVTLNSSVGNATESGSVWPGSAASPRARLNAQGGELGSTLYDFSFGRWRGVSCEGVVSGSAAQFGGLVGDLPLEFFANRIAHRAVFRVIGEAGFWLIDRPEGIQTIPWGLRRDVPVGGDFDGDGESDPAVFRPSENSFYLKLSGGGERVVRMSTLPQQIGLLREPFAADWDGDGTDDLAIVVRTEEGALAQIQPSGKAGSEFRVALAAQSKTDPLQPIVSDLDNDGRADFALVTAGKSFVLAASNRASAHLLSLPGGVAAEPLVAECAGAEGVRASRLLLLDRVRGVLLRFNDLGGALPAVSGDFSLFVEQFSNAPEELRSLLALQSAYARAMTVPSFGALGGSAEPSTRVVTRRSGGRLEWLLQTATGADRVPVAADTASYRTAATFDGAELLSFSDGLWERVTSHGGRARALWGTIGDLPVPADYNGDGLTDLAIYRHGDHSWWVRYFGGNGPTLFTQVAVWGDVGDQPVSGDFDGDGASDFAVFRRVSYSTAPTSGKGEDTASWLIRYQTGRVGVETFGGSADVPVPADYDGDGVTDLAVWRPSTGEWIVRLPSGVKRVQWGLPSDEPVRGDFDGDGRVDLAVWRRETGTWFSRPFDLVPITGVASQFGLPQDEPLGLYRTLRIY